MAGKSKTYELMLKIGGKADSSLKNACMAAGKNMSALGDSAKKFGAMAVKATAAIGAGVMAAGAGLYKVGESFDGAYDAIRIGTGATGDSLEALKGTLKAVYTSVPTEIESAATAIADYNTRLGVTGTTLEDLSKAALQVSDMLGDDLGGVVEKSSQTFQQWSLGQEDMAGAMDYIFKVSQSTGTGFTDLMADMQTYGAQLQEMGYGFHEGAVLIGQLGKEGVNATEVLGAMKKAVTTMAKSGVSATKGMDQYYEAIKNAGDATEATRIASEVFGSRAASTMTAAIRDGSLAVGDLTASLMANGETIATAAADTYDFAEKWDIFKQRMAVKFEPVGTAIFNALGDTFDRIAPQVEAFAETALPKVQEALQTAGIYVVNTIIPAIKETVGWIREHSDVILALAGGIGAAVLAYKAAKGVIAVYNTVTSLSKILALASAGATATQTAATVAQTAATVGAIAPTTAMAVATNALCWPLLLVVAAIAAVVAIVILLIKNWDKVKAVAIAVWEKIKSVWNAVATWFNTNVITPLVNFFSGLFHAVSGFFKNLWAGIKGVWNAVATWFKTNVITPLVNFFTPIIRTVSGIFSGCWILIQAVWKAVSTWFNTNVITPVVTVFSTVVGAVSGFFTTLWGDIVAVWTTVSSWFNTNVITPVVSVFSTVVEAVGGFFSTLWNDIVSVWTAVGTWFDENVATPIMNAFQAVSDFVKGIINTLLGFVEGMINKIIGVINSFIGGFSKVVGGAAAFVGVEWGGIPELPQVTLPRLATGGIVTAPTILEAGEGREPEAILPLSKLAALLDRGGKKPKGSGDGRPKSDSGNHDRDQPDPNDADGNITFAPVFHFAGPAGKAEVEAAVRRAFEEFKRMYRQMRAEERRKNLAPT